MKHPNACLVIAWLLLAAGLVLTLLPLWAYFFPIERSEPLPVHLIHEGDAVTSISEMSVTMHYIAPWVPALGGFLMLGGALLLLARRV